MADSSPRGDQPKASGNPGAPPSVSYRVTGIRSAAPRRTPRSTGR